MHLFSYYYLYLGPGLFWLGILLFYRFTIYFLFFNAKWNKPGGERQIPYDLTYKWNLINKTNKQNITRDIEIKNKLTVTRGEEGRDNGGERGMVFRNMYKRHMDKTKEG